MTREEKQKAIDALKISAPIMAVTQEEFNDYIQTLNKIMDWLDREPKTGHWIGQKKIGFGEWKECIVPLKNGSVTNSCSCSECGKWLVGSDEYDCNGNFCPNCGADMREVNE